MREREEEHLEDFRNFLKVKKLNLPAGYDDENLLVLRFLQGLKWNYMKTYEEVVEHSNWHNSISLDLDQYRQDLELGVIYGVRRDKNMRPVIVINTRRMIDSKITVDRLVSVATFFLEYVI